MRYDVIVIGGGVIGAMVLRALSRYRLSICMAERENDPARGASGANSGIVHAGFDAATGSVKAEMNRLGSLRMEQVARELGVPYRRNGSMVIGYSEEDKERLRELYDRGRANGIESLSLISGEEARRLENALSEQVSCALRAESGAIISPYALTIAAIGNAMDNGAELVGGYEVTAIERTVDGFRLIDRSGRELCARYLVNCAGLYADAIASMVGDHSFTIRPRAGEYLLLDRKCGSMLGHTIFTVPTPKGKGILISPTADGNLLLGPTAEERADKEDTATTEGGLARVMEAARRMVPDLDFRATITSFAGLRAASSTGDFIISASDSGMIHCAGIESPGLSSAPAIADRVIELLMQSGLSLCEKDDYNPYRAPIHRLAHLSEEEKNALIASDPAYGRIVCRCEQISEGEILDALRRNPRASDLDGVKRRVRAGMGRCQGAFCSPSVMEMIARELGIPMEAVTKAGEGSCLCKGRTKEEYDDGDA